MNRPIRIALGFGTTFLLLMVVNGLSSNSLDHGRQTRDRAIQPAMDETLSQQQSAVSTISDPIVSSTDPLLGNGNDDDSNDGDSNDDASNASADDNETVAEIGAKMASTNGAQALKPESLVQSESAKGLGVPSGELLMLDHSLFPEHKLVRFDLATNETTSLFHAPQDSWIYHFDLAPDGTRIALSYAAPPDGFQAGSGETNARQAYDRSGIYLLSLTDSAAEPELLFNASEAGTYLFNPIWSADGESIYYVYYRRIQPSGEDSQIDEPEEQLEVALRRYDLVTGEAHHIAQDAVWPRLSSDGKSLVYIQVDPETSERGIHLLNIDSGSVTEAVPINTFFDVDTPHLSPDGAWIYFGAVAHSTKVSQGWQDRFFGIKTAHAHTDHNLPSDWWRVPVAGGEPERLTSTRRIITFGDFADDGRFLVSATDTGVYIMDITSAEIKRLPLPNLYRFIAWMN